MKICWKCAHSQASKIRMSLFLHQVWRNVSLHQCLSNGCSAVNGCRQNESQWMLCSEWVPLEWESMDALQWMGAVRMRVNGCSAVNGCRQNESQWMLCSGWVPSEWESMDALQWMGAVRMRVNGCSAVNGCRQNESQWMLYSEWVPSEWESDKNITIIHITPVHQLTSAEDKSWNWKRC